MNGKQLEFRVRKTRQGVDTQKCPCWTGLLLTALLSECARITEKNQQENSGLVHNAFREE